MGDPVAIGPYTIYAGGGLRIPPEYMARPGLKISLREEVLAKADVVFGSREGNFLWLPITDYGTIPEHHWSTWKQRLQEVVQTLEEGTDVLVFCAGGHGRTGLFLASLLALVEPDVDDPVEVIRHRYCYKAVETPQQAAQVYRLQKEISDAASAATQP